MRVQFNLLPDVKLQYLKAERTKKTVMTAALLVTAASAFIFLVMVATVYVFNKKEMNDAGKDVKKYTNELKSIPKIDKMLTVQNQLNSIAGLHESKHVSSRLFTFLPQLTPTNVSLTKLNIDFASNTLTINGTSDSQKTVNTYIDTLKFTTYKLNGQDTKKRAFPSVIETNFSLSEKGADYTLTVQFEPDLFINSQNAELIVPSGLATTRSALDDPNKLLFTGEVPPPTQPGQGGR